MPISNGRERYQGANRGVSLQFLYCQEMCSKDRGDKCVGKKSVNVFWCSAGAFVRVEQIRSGWWSNYVCMLAYSDTKSSCIDISDLEKSLIHIHLHLTTRVGKAGRTQGKPKGRKKWRSDKEAEGINEDHQWWTLKTNAEETRFLKRVNILPSHKLVHSALCIEIPKAD